MNEEKTTALLAICRGERGARWKWRKKEIGAKTSATAEREGC